MPSHRIHLDCRGAPRNSGDRIDVEFESPEMMRQRHLQPFNHFLLQGTDGTDTPATVAENTDEPPPARAADELWIPQILISTRNIL